MSVPRIVQIVFVVFLILTILLKWGFVLNLIAAVGAIGATIWERQSSKEQPVGVVAASRFGKSCCSVHAVMFYCRKFLFLPLIFHGKCR